MLFKIKQIYLNKLYYAIVHYFEILQHYFPLFRYLYYFNTLLYRTISFYLFNFLDTRNTAVFYRTVILPYKQIGNGHKNAIFRYTPRYRLRYVVIIVISLIPDFGLSYGTVTLVVTAANRGRRRRRRLRRQNIKTI